jgi:endonuclease YncB( thermonuclease family)
VRQSKPTSNVIQFRQLRRRPQRPRNTPRLIAAMLLGTLLGIAAWYGAPDWTQIGEIAQLPASPNEPSEHVSRTFTVCGTGQHTNCVIDGDTFRLDGTKIRIAGIDTPEIHPSRCAREEQLGQAAKQRLLELLNAGPFELRAPSHDHDRYGRDLREAFRNGASLGDQLVREGLARRWDGHRRPWCD